jgi:hypothetical protein
MALLLLVIGCAVFVLGLSFGGMYLLNKAIDGADR